MLHHTIVLAQIVFAYLVYIHNEKNVCMFLLFYIIIFITFWICLYKKNIESWRVRRGQNIYSYALKCQHEFVGKRSCWFVINDCQYTRSMNNCCEISFCQQLHTLQVYTVISLSKYTSNRKDNSNWNGKAQFCRTRHFFKSENQPWVSNWNWDWFSRSVVLKLFWLVVQ